MNIVTALERAARRNPDALAVRYDDNELTYAELLELAGRFAAFLASQEIGAGDRVGIYLPNHRNWLPALLGIWKAGAVAVPLNYMFAPAALQHAVQDSGMIWLLALAEDTERLRGTLSDLPVSNRIISMTPVTAGALCWTDAVSGAAQHATVPRLDDTDALIMYTSGSTGTPKGVRQTHRNTTAECEAVIDVWRLTDADHALVCTPLFHVGGLQLISLPVLLAGGTVTLQRKWDPQAWIDRAVKVRPSVVALVPTMMIDIVNRLQDYRGNLDSVRVCAIGGAAMPETRLKAFTAVTGVTPVNIYGQTEQSGLAITEPLDEEPRYGSLGRPLDQIVQYQIVPVGKADPAEPGSGAVGELWVRGDAVTPGYWNLPDLNAQKFTGGWFRTSDLVRRDADGYLYYVDRTDDMIISGGENVYPRVVEAQLQACPLISEVAVIGTPHERWGQQITAIVCPSELNVSADDIAQWCQGQVGLRGLLRPRRIEIVDSMPRTGTNKVDVPALKRRFQ
jgi:long-chain acyl-CoA synthetase